MPKKLDKMTKNRFKIIKTNKYHVSSYKLIVGHKFVNMEGLESMTKTNDNAKVEKYIL